MALRRRAPVVAPRNGFRMENRRSGVALTAAGTRINLGDKREAQKLRTLRQGWQEDAWAYRDSIGELRYAIDFLSHCAARMRLFVGVYPTGGEDDNPIPLMDAVKDPANMVPDDLVTFARDAQNDLGNGRMAMSGMLGTLSSNVSVTGEGYLLGQQDPMTREQVWSIRSIDEIVIQGDKWQLREAPLDPQGQIGLVTLDNELTTISRMWNPHPRFRILSDSPMRAILSDCDNLLIYRRMIRADGRSRLAGRGLLLMPQDLEIKTLDDNDDDPEAGTGWFSKLVKAIVTPIETEGSAEAAVPIVIRGPADSLKEIRHIELAAKFDSLGPAIRAELIGIIATGLDLPKQVVTGTDDLNHWSAWQVDDNTFRHHVEPHVLLLCELLTVGFLRPYLAECGIPQPWVNRVVFWYDPTELVTHPDQTADAMQLHDRNVLSNAALLRVAGFEETDAPSAEEYVARLISKQRTWPANMTTGIIHEIDPALTFPPITTTGTVPGINAQGVDLGTPPPGIVAPGLTPGQTPGLPGVAEPKQIGPPAPPTAAPKAPVPAQTASAVPPPPNLRASIDPARACGVCKMFSDGKCWGYGNHSVDPTWVCDSFEADDTPPPEPQTPPTPPPAAPTAAPLQASGAKPAAARISRQLSAIDRDLRARLQVAANAALLRQLEKAGAHTRTKVNKDETARRAGIPMTLRESIAGRANERVTAILGRQALVAMGLPDLINQEWLTLKDSFYSWTGAAQEQAVKLALRLGDLDTDSDAAVTARATLATGLDAGWEQLRSSMTNIAHHLLYHPDPNTPAGDWADLNPSTLVPTGTIRAALGIAGGDEIAQGTTEFGIIKVGKPVGQIGTSSTISNLIQAGGGKLDSYEWVHGPSLRPFEPHEQLDGTVFTGFDDPALANTNGWPDNQFYIPGDHDGCDCDFVPQWMSSGDQGE